MQRAVWLGSSLCVGRYCRFLLGITTGPAPDAPLTLTVLLTFGRFPQRFFPTTDQVPGGHTPEDRPPSE